MLIFTMLLVFFISLIVVYQVLIAYARWYASWENGWRHGMNYYGKPLAQRRLFRSQIKRYSFLMPAVIGMEKLFRLASKKVPSIPSLEYDGITVPSYSCTPQSMEKAENYKPGKDDIFVVTQMKCGTTWMQNIVYEILSRGKGDLTDTGFGHLYAVSPWLESIEGVSVEKAPLVGNPPRRIIKTHLPVRFCYGPAAKYIYVMRHPVSCYASILDYYSLMSGPLAPPKETILEWYCSSRMWFTPWADHVAGWRSKSRDADNVLFLSFEEMKQDLPAVVRKVAQFLDVPLSPAELAAVEQKNRFETMKANEEYFEMSPPNFCAVRGSYFVNGTARRHESVSEADRRRIYDFCASRLDERSKELLNQYTP